MRRLVLAFLAMVAFPIAAHGGAACPIERAHYVLRGASGVSVGFRNIPQLRGWLTSLALHLDFRDQRDRFWWLFDAGSARYLNMISTTDIDAPAWRPPDDGGRRPLGETHVWFADRDYNLGYEPPKPGAKAPEHILIPDLEEMMWYRAQPRRSAPSAFFDLKSCD